MEFISISPGYNTLKKEIPVFTIIHHPSSISPYFWRNSHMKLVSYLKEEQDQLAVLVDGL